MKKATKFVAVSAASLLVLAGCAAEETVTDETTSAAPAPGTPAPNQTHRHLNQRVTRRDRRRAMPTTAAQPQVAEHGHQIAPCQRRLAVRAVRARRGQVEHRLCISSLASADRLPFAFEHARQAPHHHIEKAAQLQAHQGRCQDAERWLDGHGLRVDAVQARDGSVCRAIKRSA